MPYTRKGHVSHTSIALRCGGSLHSAYSLSYEYATMTGIKPPQCNCAWIVSCFHPWGSNKTDEKGSQDNMPIATLVKIEGKAKNEIHLSRTLMWGYSPVWLWVWHIHNSSTHSWLSVTRITHSCEAIFLCDSECVTLSHTQRCNKSCLYHTLRVTQKNSLTWVCASESHIDTHIWIAKGYSYVIGRCTQDERVTLRHTWHSESLTLPARLLVLHVHSL